MHLDEQIASQPTAVRTLLEHITVPALDPNRPVILSGIGTSSHAARVAAYWITTLSAGKIRPIAISAHDLALTFPLHAQDQVIVVSHRGKKRFPTAALARARQTGALTVAIVGQGAPEPEADAVIRTCPDETSGTHTVSYVTALTALGTLVARFVGGKGEVLSTALKTVPDALAQTLELPLPSHLIDRLAQREPILVTGFGIDAITADEAALKIKEGTYRWAEGMEVEYALHGPPAACRASMGAISITPAIDDGGRTAALRMLLHELGLEALTCGQQDEDLRFASVHPLVRPLVSIVPLQRLTAALAHKSGTNPDEIHRDVEPWASAMGRVIL